MNWDYLAGFVDGEGCLYLGQNKHQNTTTVSARIVLSSTNKKVLDFIFNFLQKEGIKSSILYKKPRITEKD